jgi:hypothetical protein
MHEGNEEFEPPDAWFWPDAQRSLGDNPGLPIPDDSSGIEGIPDNADRSPVHEDPTARKDRYEEGKAANAAAGLNSVGKKSTLQWLEENSPAHRAWLVKYGPLKTKILSTKARGHPEQPLSLTQLEFMLRFLLKRCMERSGKSMRHKNYDPIKYINESGAEAAVIFDVLQEAERLGWTELALATNL